MPRLRTFPLEIIRDHALVRFGGATALLDTGSPWTMRAPEMVCQQLGQRVRWLVGNDVMRRRRVLVDWPNRRVVLDGPALPGEEIKLVPRAGHYQIGITGPHGPVLAVLDLGAYLSYCPESAVEGREPVTYQYDFSPYMETEFQVPVYELPIRVGRRRMQVRFGLPPAKLAQMLSQAGGTGWVLGSAFFKDRSIQLELGRNRLIDASPPLPHVTLPILAAHSAPREVTEGIEAWRGWRLDDVAGSPLLRSLSAPDLWHGPVFSSNAVPTLRDRSAVGVHAYRTPMGMDSLRSSAIVYGRVTLFGQVCIHELGFRAERVRIDRLYLRACAYHGNPDARAARREPWLLGMATEQNDTWGSYCGCDTLQGDAWLTYRELERLAGRLADTYQCEVTIDPERVRHPYEREHDWQRANFHAGRR